MCTCGLCVCVCVYMGVRVHMRVSSTSHTVKSLLQVVGGGKASKLLIINSGDVPVHHKNDMQGI